MKFVSTTTTGMKRSLQCADLASLLLYDDIEHNPLMSLLEAPSKLWDDDKSVSSVDSSSSKKRRLEPLINEDTPATKALEQFLLYASEDSNFSLNIEFFETDDTLSTKSAYLPLYPKPKRNFRFGNIHDVTRGMAEISHH
jgi:hypothetical protein